MLARSPDWFLRLLATVTSSTSIMILLMHLYGFYQMTLTGIVILIPAYVGLFVLAFVVLLKRREFFLNRLIVGICGGLFATAVYDLVRLPLVAVGEGFFKPMPIFGEFLTGLPASTMLAMIIGWLYHFSNGISFGVMYAMIIGKAYWFYAVIWGLILETALLLSPYPTVLGISVSPDFVYVSFGAHLCYGSALGLFLRRFGGYSIQEVRKEIERLQKKKLYRIISERRVESLMSKLVFKDRYGRIWIPSIEDYSWYIVLESGNVASKPPSILWLTRKVRTRQR